MIIFILSGKTSNFLSLPDFSPELSTKVYVSDRTLNLQINTAQLYADKLISIVSLF